MDSEVIVHIDLVFEVGFNWILVIKLRNVNTEKLIEFLSCDVNGERCCDDSFDDVFNSALMNKDLVAMRSLNSLCVLFIVLGDVHFSIFVINSSVKSELNKICFWTDVERSSRMET